jgi:hypothetical protein
MITGKAWIKNPLQSDQMTGKRGNNNGCDAFAEYLKDSILEGILDFQAA